MARIQRVLISVSDKTGVVDFAKKLSTYNVDFLSTGGTAQALRDSGITVEDVSAYTGFPEMLDGRVKTLHPKIHGGLLGQRSNPEHVSKMEEHGIEPINMVVVNLYPFEAIVEQLEIMCRNGDLVVIMGAGPVWRVARQFLERQESREPIPNPNTPTPPP